MRFCVGVLVLVAGVASVEDRVPVVPAGTVIIANQQRSAWYFRDPVGATVIPPSNPSPLGYSANDFGMVIAGDFLAVGFEDDGTYGVDGPGRIGFLSLDDLSTIDHITDSSIDFSLNQALCWNGSYVYAIAIVSAGGGVFHYTLKKIDPLDATVLQSWNLDAFLGTSFITALGCIAVSTDGGVLFYTTGPSGPATVDIHRFDLVGSSPLSDWTGPGSRLTAGFDEGSSMVMLPDNTLLVAWRDQVIRRYNSSGSVIQSYSEPDLASGIAIGATANTFWLTVDPGGVYDWSEREISTGDPTGNGFEVTPAGTFFFGHFAVVPQAAPAVVIVEPPIPDDDPCRITTPLYWAAIEPSEELGAVLQGAQTPLRDPISYYGGYKPPLILSIGNITRAASDYLTGSLPAQSASVVWADTRRFVRNVFGTVRSDFTSSPIWIYLVDNITRLALGIPRLLFYGFLSDDPVSQDLTYTANANDLVGKDYSLLGDEVLIPKQVISLDEFPNCPKETLGLGVPIIGGTVSNADLALLDASLAGAVKLIDVGDFVCQDTVTRRALLVCIGAVKSLTLFQAGTEITTFGVDAWAPGETGWTDIVPGGEPYVTINSKWYTLVFVSGARAKTLDSATAAETVATVASGASNLAFTVGSGEAAQFTAGNQIDVRLAANSSEPELRTIDTIVTDTITVTEALSGTPAAGDTVRPSSLTIPDGADGFVRADVDGMEDVGDGSGALMEDLLLLDRHVLENFIFGDYTAGAWLDPPTFDFYPGGATSYLLDRASWETASAVGASYIGSGSPAVPFKGSFVIGAAGRRQSTRQIMADFARSGNFRRGWHGNNQFFVVMLDRNRANFLGDGGSPPVYRRTITDRRDILSSPRFAPTPMKDWLCNDLTYRYRASYRDDGHGDWWQSGNRGHGPSKLQYGVKAKVDTYPMVADRDTAEAVSQQRIDFLSELRLMWTWGQSLCALKTSELLMGVAVTHYGGKSSVGFVDAGMWVDKQVCVPKTDTVLISAVEIDNLLTDAEVVGDGSPIGDGGSPVIFGGPYGPLDSIVPPEDAVLILTTDNPQAIIDGHSAGTTYAFETGVHARTSAITPKTGDTLIGQFGAILDGSGWYTGDSTQAAIRAHNQNIDNVTIKNLVIRNFPQKGIHAFRDYASGWVVENCEIHDNKDGISLSNGARIRHCYIHHNEGVRGSGDAGLRGGNYVFNEGTDIIVEDNEISYGGEEQKSIDIGVITWRNNWVHDNYIGGIWIDGAGNGSLIEGNTVEGQAVGIWVEAAYGVTVRNNTVNGHSNQGIFLSTSRNNDVYGNVLAGNVFGIHCYADLAVVEAIASHPWGADLADNDIHGNTITTTGGGSYAGLFSWAAGASTSETPYVTNTKNNNFYNNTYHMDALSDSDWLWVTAKDWTAWQALPQDTTASGSTHVSP